MGGCCDPRGCNDMFGAGFARHQARRYRRRGLDTAAGHMVEFLAGQGVEGASVLEVGGGVGDIQLELLRRGAAHATNLELVDAYDVEARRLAAENGYDDRIERRLVDIARSPDEVDPADVVVLHRVVCCYPDFPLLLGAAADHARRLLVFSHPPRNLVSRGVVGTQNAFFALRGKQFRVFAHPPQAMLDVLGDHGFTPRYTHPGRVWQVAGLVRTR